MGGYTMFLGETQMPVTPGRIQFKTKGMNKTLTLVNDGEINFLRQPGLTEIATEVLLPMYPGYPFAVYSGGFQPPEHFLTLFETLCTGKKPAYFKLVRYSPASGRLFDAEMPVSLEDYVITEDAADGPDIVVSLRMKQYAFFGTGTIRDDGWGQPARETASAPKTQSYTVAKGDCLYNIARKYYGNGALYTKIFEANKDKISNPNLIYAGQVLTIP